LIAAALSAVAIAGCGDSDSASEEGDAGDVARAPTETAPEIAEVLREPPGRVVERAQREVAGYCRLVASALGGGKGPTPRDYERVTSAIDELASLAAQRPEATTPLGTTPRLALGDLAENLEGTNCDARLVEQIDEALAIPPAE
jgi:hypothetical protein